MIYKFSIFNDLLIFHRGINKDSVGERGGVKFLYLNPLGDSHKIMKDILCHQFVAGNPYIFKTCWHFKV